MKKLPPCEFFSHEILFSLKNGFPKGITLYLLMVCSTTSRNKQYTVTSLLATIRTGGQASNLSALNLFQDSSLMLN